MAKVQITGTYRMPDGVHTRLKAGGDLPDGFVLVAADPGFEAPEAKAIPAAPENKAELPPAVKEQTGKKQPGTVAAKLEAKG